MIFPLRRGGSPAASYKGGFVGSIPTCRTLLFWLLLVLPLEAKVGMYEGEFQRRGYDLRITHWGLTIYGDKETLKDMVDIYYNIAFPEFRGNEYILSGYTSLMKEIDDNGKIVMSRYGSPKAHMKALEYVGLYDKVLTAPDKHVRILE